MVVVSRSVHIDAPVTRVFALMADPLAHQHLNPDVEPIRVEIETGAPLRVGSVCHYRVASHNRVLDYRTRVADFVPDRSIVAVSDTTVPFEVQIETQPEHSGTRLTQTERFEPSEELLSKALPDTAWERVQRTAMKLFLSIDTDAATDLRAQREDELAHRLEDDMDRWLAAIKQHLEDSSNT